MSSNINLSAILRENNGTRLIGSSHVFQTFGAAQSSNLPLATLTNINSNVTALTVTGQNIIVGANTSYSTYIGTTSNILPPSGSGTVNGVNIGALNKRTRASYASASNATASWATRTSAADNNWNSLCWSPELGIFCAVASTGTDNRVMTSPDGITWTIQTSAGNFAWWSIAWSPKLRLFVAVANAARTMTSANGVSWTLYTNTLSNILYDIVWAEELELFVAVSDDAVMTSTDGITWTNQTDIPTFGSITPWRAVIWSPELKLLTAMSSYGDVMTSTNGVNWISVIYVSSNFLSIESQSLTYSPELRLFMGVSSMADSNGANYIISTDGVTWTRRKMPAAASCVTWSPELSIFCALTSTIVLISWDGINWVNTSSTAVSNYWRSVAWSPELSIFCVVSSTGTGNRVMTSAPGMPNAKSVVKALPSQMNVNPATGVVGIGTTAPASGVQVHVEGNIYANGNISAGNLGMFRNRIINGEMKIDQRNSGAGVGGLTGSYLTYNTQPSSFFTVDRFTIASPNIGGLTARQITLSSTDTAAVSGGFTNAVSVGLVPNDSLAVYFPFNSNITDLSGNAITPTVNGTMQYVTACVIGTNALYLANDANVIATPTKATNSLSYTASVINPITVSFWASMTKCPLSGQISTLFSFGTTSLEYFVIQASYSSASGSSFNATSTSGTTTYTLNINTWNHLAAVWIPGTSVSFYVNGSLVGTTTTTILNNLINGTITIGENVRSSLNRPYSGYIDDFRIYNRALSASEIANLGKSIDISVAPSITLASGLTTWLKFDNNTTDTQGTLSAPTVNNNNTVVYSPVCKVGTNSFDITGNTLNGAVSNTTNTFLTYTYTPTLPLSISIWINTTSLNAQEFLSIGNNTAAQATTVEIYTSGNNLGYLSSSIYIGGGNTINTAFIISTGQWYHVVITAASGGYFNMYINGILQSSKTISGALGVLGGSGSPTQLRIGASTGSSNYYASKALIDDVRIYNRVLSTQEIAGLYAESQYASYSLFQQTIEGNNLSDFGWGTSAAQPVTASMWIKNNSPAAQQFSVSANNTGMLAWLPFDGSTTADSLGFLTNPTGSVAFNTSSQKVGTACLDLTANTAGGTATAYINYNISYPVQLPLTISLWVNLTSVSAQQIFGGFGAYGINWGTDIFISSTGQLYAEASINGAQYFQATSATAILSINTWTHVCSVMDTNSISLYFNGNKVNTTYFPSNTTNVLNAYGNTTNFFRVGAHAVPGLTYATKGYIDDLRIYNRALSATQIAQIYANNAYSTTSSTYLIPRSVVYNTPAIPANSWQKVSVTIPGDTTGQWMTNNDAGLTLSLCLGASALYNTNNVAAASGNAVSVWNNVPEYMGSNVQLYASSSNNFLAGIGNSVYITGVQLEKGNLITPFESRNNVIENLVSGYLIRQFIGCYVRTSQTISSGTETVLIFGDVTTNSGHYSSSNGIFTCPVSGYYSVTLTALNNNTGSNRIKIYRNTTQVSVDGYTLTTEYASVTINVIVFCNINDLLYAAALRTQGNYSAMSIMLL